MTNPRKQGDLGFTDDELATCLEVLAALHDAPFDHPSVVQVERAASHLAKRAKQKRRAARRERARNGDRALVERTERFRVPLPSAAVSSPTSLPAETQSIGTLHRRRHCYVCKLPYQEMHAFYQSLCPSCADENYRRRSQRTDLRGRRAIVTGGRIKIGFHIALKLLRDGASVTVTTRFTRDAALRYAALPDFASFRDRLHIVGIDFRSLPDVLRWTDALRAERLPLDILVNNAAQTIRRPEAYYAQLRADERQPLALAPDVATVSHAIVTHAESARDIDRAYFPANGVDEEQLPLDLRTENSWSTRLGTVAPIELVETHVVNALVPFILADRLHDSMTAAPAPDRYVVNVSAMEGQFARLHKTPDHPHTNMAKAALNMLTRTAAARCALDGIYMCSVDTGWVTDENPHPKKARLRDAGFRPPLDVVDGAARVYDPIVRGTRGEPVYGCFLKDYRVTPW